VEIAKSPQPVIDANSSRPFLFENRSKRYRWHAEAYEYAPDDPITQALKKPLSETSIVSSLVLFYKKHQINRHFRFKTTVLTYPS
jgi:hypothetical protein